MAERGCQNCENYSNGECSRLMFAWDETVVVFHVDAPTKSLFIAPSQDRETQLIEGRLPCGMYQYRPHPGFCCLFWKERGKWWLRRVLNW